MTSREVGRRRRRFAPRFTAAVISLLGVILAMGAMAGRARASDETFFGREIQRCEDLRYEGDYEASYGQLKTLWEESRQEMSTADRIRTLELFGEIFCIWKQWDDAQNCYERALSLDLNWTPKSMWNLPASYRDPILRAFRKRFGEGQGAGLSNLALFDVIVVDLHREPKAEALKPALPMIINDLIQRSLDAHDMKCNGIPVRVVPQETRHLMMQEVRNQYRLDDATLDYAHLDRSTIVTAGRHLAVQGFVQCSLARTPKDELRVTIQLISVETAAIVASESALGRFDEMFKVLEEAVDLWATRVAKEVEHWKGSRDDDRRPGPARSYEALLRYADALRHVEEESFVLAVLALEECLEVDPGYDEARSTLEAIRQQQRVVKFIPSEPRLEMIPIGSPGGPRSSSSGGRGRTAAFATAEPEVAD